MLRVRIDLLYKIVTDFHIDFYIQYLQLAQQDILNNTFTKTISVYKNGNYIMHKMCAKNLTRINAVYMITQIEN